MISKVFFYNFWHNGDLHLSRSLVRRTIEILEANNICHEFEYFHPCNQKTIMDIPRLKQTNVAPSFLSNAIATRTFIENNILYINTWFRADNYMAKYGLTFDCLYFIFKDSLREKIGIDISNEAPLSLFPTIDYSVYDIERIRYDCVHTGYKSIVLFCNNNVESLQSENFSFDSVISRLATTFTNTLFISTNRFLSTKPNNVFFFEDLFPSLRGINNLNEISFLANYCKTVVGKASGPFTFCMTTDKISDPSKSIISFSMLGAIKDPDPRAQWGAGGYHNIFIGNYMSDKIKYIADIKQYQDFTDMGMFNIIAKAIEK